MSKILKELVIGLLFLAFLTTAIITLNWASREESTYWNCHTSRSEPCL